MPCFDGVTKNRQIIFTCHVAHPHLEDETNPAAINDMNAYRALLDTGAQMTMLSQKVVDEVGLVSAGTRPVMGIDGKITRCPRYMVDIYMTTKTGASKPKAGSRQQLVTFGRGFHNVAVARLPSRNLGVDMLIGMDILENCYLALHGNRFTICI